MPSARYPIDDFAVRIARFYHRWNVLELRLGEGIPILDVDLCPPQLLEDMPSAFVNRKQALAELEAICSELAAKPSSELVNKEYLETKFRGSVTFLQKLLGKEIPFHVLFRDMMGISPTRRTDAELARFKAELYRELKAAGVNAEKFDRAKLAEILSDPNPRLQESIPVAARNWIEEVSRSLTLDVTVNYVVQVVEEDSYWQNWITVEFGNPALLKVNAHPRHKVRLGHGDYLAAHEIAGHALNFACLEHQVRNGRIEAGALSTTIHNCEAFLFEGIAMTAGVLHHSTSNLSRWTRFRTLLAAYYMAVMNEAQMRLIEDGDIESATAFALERNVFADEVNVRKDLEERSQNPLMAVYQHVYFPAFECFQALEQVEPVRRFELLGELYCGFFTPEQIKRKIEPVG